MNTQSPEANRKEPQPLNVVEWTDSEWFRLWLQVARAAGAARNLDPGTRTNPRPSPP
jgi:hypothetical protein